MFTLQLLTTPAAATDLEVTGASVLSATNGRTIVGWDTQPTTLVRVTTAAGGFSFWADEVTAASPIIVRGLDTAITTADDQRDLTGLQTALTDQERVTTLASYTAREDSYDEAATRSRQLQGPTWLGLGRDVRTFGFSLRGVGAGHQDERLWDWIAPQWHGEPVHLPEADAAVRYHFMIGRGLSAQHDIERRLDDGRLPILTSTIHDGVMTYRTTTFACLEHSDLRAETNQGTPFLIADGHSAGHMFTPDQQTQFDTLSADYSPTEQTVLITRIVAENIGAVPRHAFVSIPLPFTAQTHLPLATTFDAATGISMLGTDTNRGYCVTTMNGHPAQTEELAPLVPAGRQITLEIRVPHTPISTTRLQALRDRSYDDLLDQTRRFWRQRLDASAHIEVPDTRLTEMIAAGLLHLDLVSYGTEPDGTIAPTIGVYAPIGSESAPIIQFYDSIGQTRLAERSLQYFVDKQHDDGFMQNFGGYMLETEAALWSFGEHFRYTRDLDWLKSVRPAVESAVGYILQNRRQQQAAPGNPHGLIMGKTADPEDPFAAYMLNGFAAIGLDRAAEMITALDPDAGLPWRQEAASLRADIRASLIDAMAGSPVVPLADGTWSRTAPPWAGQAGPLTIDRSPRRWYTHGTITGRDALLGPLWLVLQEVLDPTEPLTTELLEYHADLLFHDNAAFSQPYYSPHPLLHLRRGEVGAFLRAFYTMVASLADPQTYSFWEHYFHASPHKTHEEAWFLMQTRWMLYLEDGGRLRLLPGIPRRWLAAGQRIIIERAHSYFGEFTLRVTSDGSTVTVDVTGDIDRQPADIAVRLPHPNGPRTATVTNGTYDPTTECLMLSGYGRSVVTYD